MSENKITLNEGILWKKIVTIIAISMSLFHIYTGAFGTLEALMQRGIHLIFGLVLIFLIYPIKKNATKRNIWLENVPFVILSVITIGYLFINYHYLTRVRLEAVSPVTTIDKLFGVILILLLLEAARRAIGFILPLIASIFILYAFFGQYIPISLLRHSGYSLERIVELNYLTLNGIFGVPLGVSSSFIVLFIIFGAFLQTSGVDKLFMDIAQGLTGRAIGGPAKVAVISSGLMGSISGSAVANVLTTGAVTIPALKRLGYKPHIAGAIEAVASTGGAYMPPVMGAVAFLMAEFTGLPYITIVKHAILPALLYYISLFIMVHLEAVKQNVGTLSDEEVPNIKKSFIQNWHLIIPLVVLLTLLIKRYSPMYSAVYSVLSIIIIAALRSHTRLTFKQILVALEKGARGVLIMVAACSVAGMIIGVVRITGVGIRFTSAITEIAGGNLFMILLLSALAAILLGMALPTSVSYILLLALVIPSLIKIGIPIIAVHFFAFYFGTTSQFTPPYAVASYAAASLAETDFFKTGYAAMRLGIASYIIPFMFVYNPSLLFIGKLSNVIYDFVTAVIGIFLLAASAVGYITKPLNILVRIVAFGGAVSLIFAGYVTDIVGLACLAIVILSQVRKIKTSS